MEWTRGSVLGRGSSATVSAATSTSGEVFAVKSVAFSQSESLQKEMNFLKILKNSCVVGYKGCEISKEKDGNLIFNLFMQFMPSGSIIDLLNRRNGGGLTEFEIGKFTRQIVEGLDYLHSNGIVHCDIKGRNVLIDENGAKIGDFGCAKWVDDVNGDQLAAPICGTPMFMAPEVARGEEQGFPADIWAVGCTVIEMVNGGSPWSNVNDPVTLLYRIAFSGETPEIPDGFSDEAKDFVTKCLIRDTKQRWTAKQLLKHPFIDHNQKPKEITDSPTSILDQDVWNSIEESSSSSSYSSLCSSNSLRQRIKQLVGKSEFRQSSSNSLRQRIEQLAGKSEIVPKWRSEKGESDWMTIRMNVDGKSGGGAVAGAVGGGGLHHEWR